jgi:hypothetical protein
MAESLMEQERAESKSTVAPVEPAWKTALSEELDRALTQGGGRWSRALTAIAWIHLVTFLACQVVHDPSALRDLRHPLLWVTELIVVMVMLRKVAGPTWFWSSPAVNIIGRLWATFLILSFNLAMLNSLTGWETLWFKAAWGTLSTFFLAALACLFTPRLLIPAVQMFFTALLMARFVHWNNLIYGLSWWLALLAIAQAVRRREHEEGAARLQHSAPC